MLWIADRPEMIEKEKENGSGSSMQDAKVDII